MLGWGTSHQGTSTGGPWSHQERQWHINCLELLAATLALKTFLKNKVGVSVLLKIDNTTAVAYINNQGGTVSKELIALTKDLWMWCLERNIHIQAQHLPGVMNQVADRESRTMRDKSDWNLDRASFLRILWATRSGPICVSTDQSVPPLLQLATRSLCRGNRCVSPGLDGSERVWEPSMEFDPKSANKSAGSKSRCYTGGSGMEDSTLVSTSPFVVGRLATPSTKTIPPNRVDTHDAPTSRVEHLRKNLKGQGLSEQASDLILKSWRSKTSKSYDSLFGQWNRWCSERGSDPFSGPVSEVANFLASLYQKGYQYNSINVYRSAISSVHEKVDGISIGQHPIITRLVKGIFNVRPPLPRYSNTWDVQIVLNFLQALGKSETLPLKTLTLKMVFLLAITRPSRSADLSQLDISRMSVKENGVSFLPSTLAKQSRQGKPIENFFFPSFPQNPILCPVRTLLIYMDKTKHVRGNESKLFVSFIKPHSAVTSSTVARWLRSILD